jgi:hypothetical protein
MLVNIMSTPAERSLRLQNGFDVPSFEVFVPWHITKTELYELIPKKHFSVSAGGFWPQLEFSLFGLVALFGFNFVSSTKGELTEIQLCTYHSRRLRRIFRKSAHVLVEALGTPNLVNIPRGQLSWRYGELRIESALTKHLSAEGTKGRNVHALSISKFLRAMPTN